jgi:S-adenosylmethionine/arginine decarboxylase-like enzyme
MEHKHIIIRANINRTPKDIRKIKKWINKLITAIGMKRLGGQPLAVYCDKKGNRGLTCLAILNTSHIALHTWDEDNPGVLQLDVYTCGKLDKNIVFKHIEQFEPSNIKHFVIDRKTELRIE